MMSAAEVITRAVAAMAVTTLPWASPVATYSSSDAGEQEHLVVHGQAEEDGEHQQGHEGHDRHRGLEAHQALGPAHWKMATTTP